MHNVANCIMLQVMYQTWAEKLQQARLTVTGYSRRVFIATLKGIIS